ncbi:NAD-dependent epimerase/dehydratase family protein [Lachnospiraceae bacterium 54-53]
MKLLVIGGTGTISTPITASLAADDSNEVHVLNRGSKAAPRGARQIIGNFNDLALLKDLAARENYDVVINFIVYTAEQAKMQIEAFQGRIRQYIFISTVVTYNHETAVCIREDHEQNNVYSLYGREKAACEQLFLQAENFPVTIVRPAQTYSKDRIPLSVKGKTCYSVIHRILQGKPVIVHGDGKSTWHSTHAEDFAKGFLPLAGNEKALQQAYQIVNDEIATWDMIYHSLYELLDKKPNIIHIPSDFLALSEKYDNAGSILGDKQYSCVYDTSEIKAVNPGFSCDIDIKKGLRMYLEYMDRHPEKKVADPDFDSWCDLVIEAYEQFTEKMKGRF